MSVWSTCRIIPVNGNLPADTPPCSGWVSASFSSIKSRSASVTLNFDLYCSFRPSNGLTLPFHSEGLGHFPIKQFCPMSPQSRADKIRKWVPASYALLIHLSLSSTIKDGILPKTPAGKENAIETQRFHSVLSSYSVLVIVFSTSVISFAVAATIRKPLSLMLSNRYQGTASAWTSPRYHSGRKTGLPKYDNGNKVIETCRLGCCPYSRYSQDSAGIYRARRLPFAALSVYSFLAALKPRTYQSHIW